jgi:hypothetical protein
MDRRTLHLGALGALAAAAFVALTPGVASAATVTASPSSVAPGGVFDVTVTCAGASTSAALSGTSFGGPSEIPLFPEAGSPTSGTFAAAVTMPSSTLPGVYDLSVTCSDGDSGLGAITVTPSGTHAGEGPMGLDTGALVAGAALLALGAAGAVVLHRRGRAHV